MNSFEMEGFLHGKCLPGDMKVNENNTEYLVRKFSELEQRLIESERYGRQTDITIDNLELKLAQMAAENAGLKESRQRLAEFIHEELDADYPLNMDIETQATDAFLAEVRAQGVDLICDYHKSRCEALHDVDRNGSHRHGAALCDAIDIAAQLRKERR